MDVSRLIRDPSRVKAALLEGKDNSLIAKVPCKVMIPARFVERGLAALEPEVYTTCIFALIIEDKYYSVLRVASSSRLTPNEVNRVAVGGVEYLEFTFVKGAVISPNLNLVVRNEIVYFIYNELVAKGNVPWYITYDDLGRIFESSPKFANATVGANHAVWEMIVSQVARMPDDKTVYYRHGIKSAQDLLTTPPVIVPLRSITYGPTNTVARLIGAHFKESVTVALANPCDTVEPIEDLLRR